MVGEYNLLIKKSTDAVTSKFCTYINNKPIIQCHICLSNSQALRIDLSNFNTSKYIKYGSYVFEKPSHNIRFK